MSWDWDADLDENDRWIWVPITPKTLDEEALQAAEAKLQTVEVEEELLTTRSEPHQVMSMYVVTNGPRGVIQASMPVPQVVGTPIMGPMAIVQASSEWSRLTESSKGAE